MAVMAVMAVMVVLRGDNLIGRPLSEWTIFVRF
jgi:hypothetical protein